jgi:iron-sulfur cluster assembly protein
MATDMQTQTATDILVEAPPQLISMSTVAVEQLRTLLTQQDNPEMALRVFVYPGGCSGMSYGMAFEDEFADDDTIFTQEGLRLVVDENSAYYLQGAQIDFEDSLMGGGFRIFNPNAVRSCGCGHSFDTGEDAGNARACGCGGH